MKNRILIFLAISILFSCGKTESNQEIQTKGNQGGITPIIVATGKIEPEDEIINLSASSGGLIKEIYKKEGEFVEIGEVLVQLDDEVEISKINEKKAEIETQKYQIEIEKAKIKEEEINLLNKKSLLKKTENLVNSNAEKQQTYDDLLSEVKVLEKRIERLNSGIYYASNRLSVLQAQLKTVEIEFQKRKFISPFSGILLDLKIKKGSAINQYESYAELAPNGNLVVRAEVDELFSSKVKVGQLVEIVNIGDNKILGTGTLTFVAPYLKKKSIFSEKANDQEDRRVREIKVSINEGEKIIINSKVECRIKI